MIIVDFFTYWGSVGNTVKYDGGIILGLYSHIPCKEPLSLAAIWKCLGRHVSTSLLPRPPSVDAFV